MSAFGVKEDIYNSLKNVTKIFFCFPTTYLHEARYSSDSSTKKCCNKLKQQMEYVAETDTNSCLYSVEARCQRFIKMHNVNLVTNFIKVTS